MEACFASWLEGVIDSVPVSVAASLYTFFNLIQSFDFLK